VPDHKSKRPGWILLIAVTAASGGLYYFSLGLEGYRALAWIAPLPILSVLTEVRPGIGALLAFSAYVLGALNLVPYLSRLAPLPLLLVTLIVPSIAFAAATSAFRSALTRDHVVEAALVFPAIWTSYEFLLSLFSPHGTAGSIAYSQADFLKLIQVCSLTGIWGITFLLTFVPAGIAAAWHLRRKWQRSVPVALATLAVFTLTLLYGSTRSSDSTDRQALSVGLAASDTTQKYFDTNMPDQALTVTRAFVQQVDQLKRLGAEVVLLPEKFVGITHEDSASVIGMLGEAAQTERVTIIAGLNLIAPAPRRNVALTLSDRGTLLACYDKAFPLPGIESGYHRGSSITLFPLRGTRAGLLICRDMDFPGWVRQYERAGARILFVPAWDFGDDAWLHSRMAILRGVELGCAVVRCASEGLLSVSDYRGDVVETRSSGLPMSSLVAQILPGPGRTLYSIAGDWFAWVNIITVVIILGRNARNWRRRGS
jgi:apolipoprotein N-acyltransferase